MLLKISAILIVLVGLVVGLSGAAAHPQTITAQEETWKTYLNPIYKFSMEYPSPNITAIIEIENYDVIIGDSDKAESLFKLEIIPKNETQDIKSLIEKDKNMMLSDLDLNYSLFQDVKSVNYPKSNMTGYEYIVFSRESDLMSREIFVTNEQTDNIYFFDSGMSRYDYNNTNWIDLTINSIKFFD